MAPRLSGCRLLCTDEPKGWAPGYRRRPIPNIDSIRNMRPADLEDARLDLIDALKMIGDGTPATDYRRVELLRLLASTYLRLGNSLSAEELVEEALDIGEAAEAMTGTFSGGDASRRELHFLFGVCLQKTGREEEAALKFQKVLLEDEGHWRARFHLATARISDGRNEEAEQLLERVLAESPPDSSSYATTATLLAKLKELRDAEAGRLDLLEHDDEQPDTVR